MQAARAEKFGSIFKRTTGLIQSGVLRWEDRPLWYDVYVAAPPTFDPHWTRPAAPAPPLRSMLYAEDVVRARFYKELSDMQGVFRMDDGLPDSRSELFLRIYKGLAEDEPKLSDDELFSQASTRFRKQVGAFGAAIPTDRGRRGGPP